MLHNRREVNLLRTIYIPQERCKLPAARTHQLYKFHRFLLSSYAYFPDAKAQISILLSRNLFAAPHSTDLP